MRFDRRRLFLVAACWHFSTSGALAQDPTPTAAARQFTTAINARINAQANPADRGITMSNGRVDAGYYRIVVERLRSSGAPTSANLPPELCRRALESPAWRSSGLLDLLFDRKYDLGVAVGLRNPAQPASEAPQTEIQLFRLLGEDRNCRFELSYFDRMSNGAEDASFFGPWLPIATNQQVGAQQVTVEFRPWAIRRSSASRVGLLWRGLSGFANLLGPIGSIFTNTADEYQIRGQLGSSLSRFVDSNELGRDADSDRRLTRPIFVVPESGATAGTHRPNEVSFQWPIGWATPEGGQRSFDLNFRVRIEYRGSQLANGARLSTALMPNALPDPMAAIQSDMPPAIALAAGSNVSRSWAKITPAVANLSGLSDLSGFEAACTPAREDLVRLGFSPEDTAFLIYHIIKNRTSAAPQQLARIKCLAEMRPALERAGINLPEAEEILPRVDGPARQAFLAMMQQVLQSPTRAAAAQPFVAPTVLVAGNSGWYGRANAPVFSSVAGQGTTLMVQRGAFVQALTGAPSLNPRCHSSGSMPASAQTFLFPSQQGLADDPDPRVAFLVRSGPQQVGILIFGFSGMLAGQPQVSQLWVGRPQDLAYEEDREALRRELGNEPACQALLAEALPPPAPRPAPPAAQNPAPPPAPDPAPRPPGTN